jgi:two-component system chemotaxis sensor kinase CheA
MIEPAHIHPSQPRGGWGRQLFFTSGLAAIVLSAAGYMWLQGPLRRSIAVERELAENVGRIMTLDEILTMSARMAAAARNPAYAERYDAHVAELDELIGKTVGLSEDPEVAAAVRSTEEANRRLVDIETRSFELDGLGRHGEALAILDSESYRADKAVYAAGMARAFAVTRDHNAKQRAAEEQWALILQLVALFSIGAVASAWAFDQREQRRRATRHAAELAGSLGCIEDRNRSMRRVLDTVQQGLLTVDLDGTMSAERSAVVERWLGPSHGQATLGDYARAHDPQFAESFELGMGQLREDFLPLELCLDQLPKRLVIGTRTVAVDYEPIVADGRACALLVVMSDVTAEIERERLEVEQLEQVSILKLATRDRGALVAFLGEAARIVEGLGRSTSELSEKQLIHTLKGSAAQVGLIELARVCHKVEENISLEGELTPRDRESIDAAWRRTKERIDRVFTDRSRTHLEVERIEYDNVVDLVQRRVRHHHIHDELRTWILDPVQVQLERLGEHARALCERLGKASLAVRCDANGLRVDAAELASFWPACVHLVRNAVDHGIEAAAVRRGAGKPEGGRLTLTADRRDGALVVRIADDGAGIDWAEVERRAAARGLPVATEAQLVDALWTDDVSTRDRASEYSGRGVGMAAVRTEVERRGGHVSVHSHAGRGTTIELTIPQATPIRMAPAVAAR